MHTHQIMATNNNSSSSPSSPQSSYNSSYGSNSGQKLINTSNISTNSSPIAALVPGGVVTTQNISTVIRPKSNNNSLQFVKIQTPELSKTAVEQIKLAEETKISKDKVKEVEEEWQNNLLNWKSKRRQQITQTFEQAPNDPFDTTDNGSGRKIKTFAEMIEQRAKSGNRLGFHLQRYLGSEDDDDEIASTNAVQDDTNNNNNSQSDHHSKSRVDSDCEFHSSTSSGYNQLDSKGSSSPETPLEEKPLGEDLVSARQPFLKCDSISSNFSRDEPRETHSISLVESSQLDQLNSTLKEDLKPPPLPPQLNRLSLSKTPDAKAPLNELPVRSEDESDEQGSEEEEQEEEEEQKQLQRIAFEAKLKAFEKLTNCSVAKPVVAPKRLLKPQVSRPIPIPKQQLPSSIPPPLQPVSDSPTPPEPLKKLPAQVKPPQPPAPPIQIQLPTPLPTKQQQQPIQLPTPIQPPPLPPVQLSPSKPSPPLPPPIQQPSPRIAPQTHISVSPQLPPPLVQAPKQEPVSPEQSAPNKLPSPPPPTPPPPQLRKQPTPDQRKPIKEDKDKSILSVSGKKRCSSCKEELGRGAAAFVVESLSLVYHTNCFRCSVCHVNLSNGFRGVDVRVHAGALHCQNCYSKDGLNYSRV